MILLQERRPEDINRETIAPIRDDVLSQARIIVDRVRSEGYPAVRQYAHQFSERKRDEPLVLGRDSMQRAFDALDANERGVLVRTAERIKRFAAAQRDAIQPVTLDVPGGQAGHTIEPVRSAGCYAPAGRYPLPSSVLMTAITARTAGCERIVVASPGASPIMLATAYIAQADEFLCIGGAHAIAALAYGFDFFERTDVIVGPGNAWVTAAKQLVSGEVGIDMLAGPSELLILADQSTDIDLVAADLLAQAEHDTDAVPILVTTQRSHVDAIQAALEQQLSTLPTADTARDALYNGFVVVCDSISQSIDIANQIAPEHLEILTDDAQGVASRIQNAGGVFIGQSTAEVVGDYGIGPNHTLPTGGTARFQAGLSVMHFLRLRTWIKIDDPYTTRPVTDDAAQLARMEGLIGHERSATCRVSSSASTR